MRSSSPSARPSKLLAQVLAGAQYPDQITAANQWLTQNPALKGNALQDAADQQAWDVSIKSLTAFPAVLSQMANNIQWTTALGLAYANAPNDVMNAVQTMRQRAQQSGNLKNNSLIRVTASPRLAPPPEYADDARYYSVPPPPQTIIIESAQADVVYVPDYNPALVYGPPIPVYPNYVYHPSYGGNLIAGSIISFGVGVIVGSALSHQGWGWHSWGMNWGGHGYGPDYGANPGWTRPAVTYNNTVYAPRSSITINRNYDTRITTNNFGGVNRPPISGNVNGNVNESANGNRPNFGNPNQHRPPPPNNGVMTMPHFSPADQHEGARPATPAPQFHADRPAPALPARENQLRQSERRQDSRPRSEIGERLNSAEMQGSPSRHSLSTSGRRQTPPERTFDRNENRAPTSLRSDDVQRGGIKQRHEDFRQQSRPEPRAYNPPAAPQMNAQPQMPQQMQQQPRPQAPQFHPAPQQAMPHPQEPRVQAPRPPQEPQQIQERAQQERPQHAQERPHPAPRQEERREGK